MWLFFQMLLQINVCKFDFWQIWIKWMKICIKSSQNSIWNFILTENSISESTCLRVIVCRYLVEFYRKMPPKKSSVCLFYLARRLCFRLLVEMEITISILTIPWEKKLKIWLTLAHKTYKYPRPCLIRLWC